MRQRPVIVAAALIGLFVVGVAPSLGQTLLESHAFRQTQTAYTAVLYAERGIDLLRPPLPVLGPPGVIPLEFPLFQGLGALIMEVGAPADLAMRLTGLGTFVLAAAGLFALARRMLSPLAAVAALFAFLFNAHAWLYGRTSLIEYLAAGAGVAFLYFALRWAESSRRSAWTFALLAGSIATLVKITTGGFYLLPALLLRRADGRLAFRSPATWALIGGAALVGFGWSAYAQGVRSETPAAAFLDLQSQPAWLFGTLRQRLDLSEWRVPLVAILMLTGSAFVVWIPIAIAHARWLAQGPFALALVVTAVGVPLLLFNLYAVHDYYFAAVAPLVAIAVGLGVDWIRERWDSRWGRRVAVGLTGAWAATLIGLIGSWSIIYGTPPEEERALEIAEFINDHSEPSDWVIQDGLGWNPSFLYYARRQGIAVPDHAGFQDTSTIDLDVILADPRLGPTITCDRDGRCRVGD